MAPSACTKPAKHNTVSKTNRCVHKYGSAYYQLMCVLVCVGLLATAAVVDRKAGRTLGRESPLTVISIAGSHLADCLRAHTHTNTTHTEQPIKFTADDTQLTRTHNCHNRRHRLPLIIYLQYVFISIY